MLFLSTLFRAQPHYYFFLHFLLCFYDSIKSTLFWHITTNETQGKNCLRESFSHTNTNGLVDDLLKSIYFDIFIRCGILIVSLNVNLIWYVVELYFYPDFPHPYHYCYFWYESYS